MSKAIWNAGAIQDDLIQGWVWSNKPLPAGSSAGSYVLICSLAKGTSIRVGCLGTLAFAAGDYAYAGSAKGPGGLKARLIRHLNSRTRAKHWHIDYLLSQADVRRIFWAVSELHLECGWAAALQRFSGQTISGFGSSDCGCGGHLVRLDSNIRDERIRHILARVLERRVESNNPTNSI